ncbi:MAG: NlpC/P60 family protein, partial [Clostridia bacterium]|nr:NlpC/P60 family protein [Clostridia bacterium]
HELACSCPSLPYLSDIALFLVAILIVSIPATADSAQVESLLSVALEQLGRPYELFSTAPDSFNCLTFVMYCYNQVESGTFSFNRVEGGYERITSMRNVKPGDIVCFKSSSRLKGILGYHFGIFVGRGYFIHASSSIGKVCISKLKKFKKKFVSAVRVF